MVCMSLFADISSGTNPKYLSRQISLPDSLVNFAQTFLKTPYRYGSTGVKTFDCSGFSGFVYKNFGYNLSRSASGQAGNEGVTIDRMELQPGDLVFFKGRNAKRQRVGHVGIVVEADGKGKFKFIHASVSRGVTITDSQETYYRGRYVSAKRVLKENLPDILIEPIEVVIPSLVVH
jgi:cell wall-associated NlpC family hydrolase